MTRRWPALILIPALLAGALLYDQRPNTERARRARQDMVGTAVAGSSLAQYMPVAAPGNALSSIWYCAAGTAEPTGEANEAVVIANPGPTALTGTVTAVTSTGRRVVDPITVGRYSRLRVTLLNMVTAPYVAAQVEFRGGQGVVEEEVTGNRASGGDIDATPCASAPSSTWYFAAGATTPNASETLELFNPFPNPATVNVSFATPDGARVPTDYQGLGIPGGSVLALNIDPEVSVESEVATSVAAVSGSVVAARIQTFDGKPAAAGQTASYEPQGVTVDLGVPQPAERWMFPVGIKQPGAHEQFVVFNPGPTDAEVAVAVSLVDPEVNGQVDPITLSVPAGGFQIVDMDSETRVPTMVDHSVVVLSTNHVPVVVARLLATGKPYPAEGTAVSSGTPLVAPEWVFASGGNVPAQLSERISVQNPSGRSVTVRIEVIADGHIGPVTDVGPVTLGPYGHTVVRFANQLDNRQVAVLVSANAPIAAERLLYRVYSPGMSTAMGIPLPDGLALVPAGAAGQ